jgi:hypothetical protein
MKYAIFAGLGGGYGGAVFIDFEDCTSMEQADEIACECARDTWESYGGMAGVDGYDFEEYQKEYPDATESDYDDADNEAFDSWADYHAEEYDSNKEYG